MKISILEDFFVFFVGVMKNDDVDFFRFFPFCVLQSVPIWVFSCYPYR